MLGWIDLFGKYIIHVPFSRHLTGFKLLLESTFLALLGEYIALLKRLHGWEDTNDSGNTWP